MTLVQRIRTLCKNENISMFELEERTGIKHGNIYRWDVKRPSVDKALAVAKHFGVSVEYLLGEENQPSDSDKLQTALLGSFNLLSEENKREVIWFCDHTLFKQGADRVKKDSVM